MKIPISFAIIRIFFSLSITTVSNHVLATHENNLLSLLTVDNLMQDEMCAKVIHENPCAERVLERLVNKMNNLDKKLELFRVYQETVEENFSEIHILKTKLKLLDQRKNEKRNQQVRWEDKQKQSKTKRNDDRKNNPFVMLFKLFWHKLMNYDWGLEVATSSNSVDNSTVVR